MEFAAVILTPGDIDTGWRTVWQEARSEGYAGMLAVAWVVRNRLEYKAGDRWGTVAQVCLDWLQFSGWREQDGNFLPAEKAVLDDNGLLCLRALLQAFTTGKSEDPTYGARNYHAKEITPPWAVGHKPCVVIGRHLFYNDIA